MKKKNVLNCQFSAWYPALKNVTVKSRIVPLPAEVLAYLHADGLVLPEGAFPAVNRDQFEGHSDDEDWNNEEGTPTLEAPCFTEFDNQIRNYIKALGGKVFPKLNWSSPQDATWISMDGTLGCRSPGDIYLLLKSSDFVAHDISKPFHQCEDYVTGEEVDVKYELVLRQWMDINTGGEFRCFVKDGKLIGVCQRHHSSYFPFLREQQENILTDICRFYRDNLQGSFPDSEFVFDIYRKKKNVVYLIDINPFGTVTESLLFDWEELLDDRPLMGTDDESICQEGPVFRYVSSPAGVQPHPYSTHALPQDIVHLTRGEDPHKLLDLLKLKIQGQGQDSSSDDEDATLNT